MRERFGSLVSKGKKQEITDAERAELVLKVYPRLKKRSKVLRFLKIGNAVFLLLFLCSCATTGIDTEPKPDKASASVQIKTGMVQEDLPDEFEKTMPDSEIMLSSIVSFSRQPTVKHIADDVIDADYDSGILVILKKDRLETNIAECPSVLLKDDRYLSTAVSGGTAIVAGADNAFLIDLKNCGIIYQASSKGRGFAISDKYFMEFTRNTFDLYDQHRTAKKQGGNFLGSVVAGQLSGDSVMFANENGKVALMSAENGKYTAIYPDILGIKEIYFNEEGVFVYNTDNKLLQLVPDFENGTLKLAKSAQAKDGCFLLKKSGKLFCDGYILGIEAAYKSPIDASRGIVSDGLIFLIKDGSMSFVDTELKYKKSVQLAKSDKKLCLKDGRAFFTDFDSSVKYLTAKGEEVDADTMPESCDHRFDFKSGSLMRPDGGVIYKYADVVNRSEKALMLKRVIGDDIFYYFERLSD